MKDLLVQRKASGQTAPAGPCKKAAGHETQVLSAEKALAVQHRNSRDDIQLVEDKPLVQKAAHVQPKVSAQKASVLQPKILAQKSLSTHHKSPVAAVPFVDSGRLLLPDVPPENNSAAKHSASAQPGPTVQLNTLAQKLSHVQHKALAGPALQKTLSYVQFAGKLTLTLCVAYHGEPGIL